MSSVQQFYGRTTGVRIFLGQEGPDRVLEAYGREKFERLTALKNRYDPNNFFRVNQNIPSAACNRKEVGDGCR